VLGAAFLVLVAIGPLLVADLRADPGTWIFSGVLIAIAVVYVVINPPWSSLRTARQVKFFEWWGYTSHDGDGEQDTREKRGNQRHP
jgi:hypothetical protein